MKLVNSILAIGTAFLKAFVLWKLYNWFLLPLGFPNITMAHLYGVTLFFAIFTISSEKARKIKTREKDDDVDLKVNVFMIIAYSISLLVGYLIK